MLSEVIYVFHELYIKPFRVRINYNQIHTNNPGKDLQSLNAISFMVVMDGILVVCLHTVYLGQALDLTVHVGPPDACSH